MKRNRIFTIIRTIFGSIILIIIFAVIIILSVKSVPGLSLIGAAYPAPIDSQTPPHTSNSAESLCDTWFSFRKELSAEKRSSVEKDYQKCVESRTTPAPPGATKPLSSTPVGEYDSIIYQKATENGVILESGISPFNSSYRIINQWIGDIGNDHIIIYAGGKRNDLLSASEQQDDLSWPGIIIVSAKDKNGQYLPNNSGNYLTPINLGPVRILSTTNDMILTLAANDGTSFIFNISERRFISAKRDSPINRLAGKGTIIESGKTPFIFDQFNFINYLYYDNDNGERITFIAGKEKEGSKLGTFVIVISSSTDVDKITNKMVFKSSISDDSLRIIDADDNKIVLISEENLLYEFNISEMKFTKLPTGGQVFLDTSGIDNTVSTPNGIENALSLPTRTPLPTYNPYP